MGETGRTVNIWQKEQLLNWNTRGSAIAAYTNQEAHDIYQESTFVLDSSEDLLKLNITTSTNQESGLAVCNNWSTLL